MSSQQWRPRLPKHVTGAGCVTYRAPCFGHVGVTTRCCSWGTWFPGGIHQWRTIFLADVYNSLSNPQSHSKSHSRLTSPWEAARIFAQMLHPKPGQWQPCVPDSHSVTRLYFVPVEWVGPTDPTSVTHFQPPGSLFLAQPALFSPDGLPAVICQVLGKRPPFHFREAGFVCDLLGAINRGHCKHQSEAKQHFQIWGCHELSASSSSSGPLQCGLGSRQQSSVRWSQFLSHLGEAARKGEHWSPYLVQQNKNTPSFFWVPVGKVHFWYLLKSNRSIDNTWQFHL